LRVGIRMKAILYMIMTRRDDDYESDTRSG
jgi:hypothetical protein